MLPITRNTTASAMSSMEASVQKPSRSTYSFFFVSSMLCPSRNLRASLSSAILSVSRAYRGLGAFFCSSSWVMVSPLAMAMARDLAYSTVSVLGIIT